jgi:hypothetical protein
MIGPDTMFAEPGQRRPMDHAVQPSTVDRKLRHVIARSNTAGLTPYFLTKTISVNQFIGADGDRVQSLQQPKLSQFANRMRQRIDADPKLADRLRLLIYFAI